MTEFATARFGSQATDALNAGQQGNSEAMRRLALNAIGSMNDKEIARIMGRVRAPQPSGGFNWGNALGAASDIVSSFRSPGSRRQSGFDLSSDFGISPLSGVGDYSSVFR